MPNLNVNTGRWYGFDTHKNYVRVIYWALSSPLLLAYLMRMSKIWKSRSFGQIGLWLYISNSSVYCVRCSNRIWAARFAFYSGSWCAMLLTVAKTIHVCPNSRMSCESVRGGWHLAMHTTHTHRFMKDTVCAESRAGWVSSFQTAVHCSYTSIFLCMRKPVEREGKK